MLFDSHVHSAASPDSEMLPNEAIEALAKQGLGCVFTEHVDFCPKKSNDFMVDLDIYPKSYLPYKSDSVLLGLEIGLTAECIEKNRVLASSVDFDFINSFDFIIGSIHIPDFTNGVDLAFFGEQMSKMIESGDDPYRRYLFYALEMVRQNDFFDALGHIDYISRYSPQPGSVYGAYPDEYDALFRALIEANKVMEFNTARIGDKHARQNLFDIYSRYYALGGRYVTLGSDAHTLSRLGDQFPAALRLLNEIGLQIVYFSERKKICIQM